MEFSNLEGGHTISCIVLSPISCYSEGLKVLILKLAFLLLVLFRLKILLATDKPLILIMQHILKDQMHKSYSINIMKTFWLVLIDKRKICRF